jgi:hypothetical protein
MIRGASNFPKMLYSWIGSPFASTCVLFFDTFVTSSFFRSFNSREG